MASYPSSAKTYTTKATDDSIEASHVNDLQDEVTALETALLGSLAHDIKFTDATYDIGKSGATRPRDGFFSRNVVIGGTLGVTGVATFTAVPVFSAGLPTLAQNLIFTDATYDIGAAGATRPKDLYLSGWHQWAGQSRVSSQFNKTTDTTLANVTGLTVTLEAGKTYAFRAVLFCTTTTNGGAKVALSGTVTATTIIAQTMVTASGNFIDSARVTALNSNLVGITAQVNQSIVIEGTITVNAAGTLTVQFAQNASHADTSSVLVGSTFTAWRLT